jgi:hypothetical protein
MKKHILILYILLCYLFSVAGQNFSVGADAGNILFVGLDNPLRIAVENLSSKSIVVKVDNGKITGNNGKYIFNTDKPGRIVITLYKKANGRLKEIGKNYFIVKNIPNPVFKIGSGEDSIKKIVLQVQEYCRADLDCFCSRCFDIRYSVKSFTVCIISTDTCGYVEKNNVGNKISEEIRAEFRKLKENDIVIFKNIICIGPDGRKVLKPRMITIYE